MSGLLHHDVIRQTKILTKVTEHGHGQVSLLV